MLAFGGPAPHTVCVGLRQIAGPAVTRGFTNIRELLPFFILAGFELCD
jgi:hypothetical protein